MVSRSVHLALQRERRVFESIGGCGGRRRAVAVPQHVAREAVKTGRRNIKRFNLICARMK